MLFGQKVIDELEDKPIICSGVTFGGFSPIINYLEKMMIYLALHHKPNGYDQVIHNYIIHKNQVENVK